MYLGAEFAWQLELLFVCHILQQHSVDVEPLSVSNQKIVFGNKLLNTTNV